MEPLAGNGTLGNDRSGFRPQLSDSKAPLLCHQVGSKRWGLPAELGTRTQTTPSHCSHVCPLPPALPSGPLSVNGCVAVAGVPVPPSCPSPPLLPTLPALCAGRARTAAFPAAGFPEPHCWAPGRFPVLCCMNSVVLTILAQAVSFPSRSRSFPLAKVWALSLTRSFSYSARSWRDASQEKLAAHQEASVSASCCG